MRAARRMIPRRRPRRRKTAGPPAGRGKGRGGGSGRGVGAPDPGAGDKARPASVEHHVKQGETLYSIAHAYKTSDESISQANSFLGERPLKAGDVLTIQR